MSEDYCVIEKDVLASLIEHTLNLDSSKDAVKKACRFLENTLEGWRVVPEKCNEKQGFKGAIIRSLQDCEKECRDTGAIYSEMIEYAPKHPSMED